MSGDQAIERMTEAESQRFAEKLQAWGMTLQPKEQHALAAVLWCAGNAGDGGREDVAGHYLQSRARFNLALGGANQLGDFEVQDLMSAFDQAQTLVSGILKQRNDTTRAAINKI